MMHSSHDYCSHGQHEVCLRMNQSLISRTEDLSEDWRTRGWTVVATAAAAVPDAASGSALWLW